MLMKVAQTRMPPMVATSVVIALAMASTVSAQAAASIRSDDTGIVVSVPQNQNLFVERVRNNGNVVGTQQEVVLKSEFDQVSSVAANLQSQYSAMSSMYAQMSSQVSSMSNNMVSTSDFNRVDSGLSTATSQLAPLLVNLPARVANLEAPTPSPPSAPPTIDCPDGHRTDGTCMEWRSVAVREISDVVTNAVHVNVSLTDQNDPTSLLIRGIPTDSGCGRPGNIHSSMGIYIAGGWIKIKYQQTMYGTTSCFSMFGATSYNAHEHSDVSDLTSGESITGTRLYLGAEEGGLFPLDPNFDTLSNPSSNVDSSMIDKLNRLQGHQCDPQGHIWKNIPSGESRSITAELRRFYRNYGDSDNQYSRDAGPTVGLSCSNLGSARWEFSNIQILI